MLKDKIRTDAYRDFILANPSIFKDAVVLDVGCGSGQSPLLLPRRTPADNLANDRNSVDVRRAIWSEKGLRRRCECRSAQGGTEHQSEWIERDHHVSLRPPSSRAVAERKYRSVIKGKIEDIELPEKVDVIVSEWMGYFLLFVLPSLSFPQR